MYGNPGGAPLPPPPPPPPPSYHETVHTPVTSPNHQGGDLLFPVVGAGGVVPSRGARGGHAPVSPQRQAPPSYEEAAAHATVPPPPPYVSLPNPGHIGHHHPLKSGPSSPLTSNPATPRAGTPVRFRHDPYSPTQAAVVVEQGTGGTA